MTVPTTDQIGTARDALALVTLTWADDLDGATELVASLLRDPEALPGVLAGLVGITAQALASPPDVTPEAFVAACHALLDDAEQGDGPERN
jgi:hypothetical protein